MSILRTLGTAFVLTAGIALAAPPAPSAPLLYASFQDHMVIQRDKPITVWGKAAPGAQVSVVLMETRAADKPATGVHTDAFANIATADADGHWRTTIPTPNAAGLPAGGPYTLIVKSGKQEQTVSDILFGDVYLCSGQSNMEMPVHVVSNYDTDLNGATNKQIRLMHVERFASAAPREDFGAGVSWAVTSPEAVKDFSATCYFFGRELQPEIGVPLGLIEAAWGGSTIQPWLPAGTLRDLGLGYALDILADYAKDPAAAEAKWREVANAWWRTNDPGSNASSPWYAPAFDDSAWAEIVPAGIWEGWGVEPLRKFDGIVWFRKTVTLTAEQAKGASTLALGPIDDYDTTFVNGVQVGAMAVWDAKRIYTVPAGTLHEGRNTIAVGVFDSGAGGGMWGKASDKTLTFADGSTLVLDTPWRWKIAADARAVKPIPLAPWTSNTGLAMLYNGMIDPLGPITLKGIVWYQGESNVTDARNYGTYLKALIASWRHRFGEDLPFLAVQIPGYESQSTVPFDSNWAALREQQRLTMDKTANSGLAVTIDIGQRDNIHPTDKQNVGKRLALIARKLIYGQDVIADGPRPLSAVRKGKTIVIAFDRDFDVMEANRPLGFQLCEGEKCAFVDAVAKGNSIAIKAGAKATEVRFCWADSPICNIYGKTGLPAIPFRLPIEPAKRK